MGEQKPGHRIMYDLLTKLGCAILGGAVVAYYRDLLPILGLTNSSDLFFLLFFIAVGLIMWGLYHRIEDQKTP